MLARCHLPRTPRIFVEFLVACWAAFILFGVAGCARARLRHFISRRFLRRLRGGQVLDSLHLVAVGVVDWQEEILEVVAEGLQVHHLGFLSLLMLVTLVHIPIKFQKMNKNIFKSKVKLFIL